MQGEALLLIYIKAQWGGSCLIATARKWGPCVTFSGIKENFFDSSTLVYVCLHSASDSPTLVYTCLVSPLHWSTLVYTRLIYTRLVTRLCFQNIILVFFFKKRNYLSFIFTNKSKAFSICLYCKRFIKFEFRQKSAKCFFPSVTIHTKQLYLSIERFIRQHKAKNISS